MLKLIETHKVIGLTLEAYTERSSVKEAFGPFNLPYHQYSWLQATCNERWKFFFSRFEYYEAS